MYYVFCMLNVFINPKYFLAISYALSCNHVVSCAQSISVFFSTEVLFCVSLLFVQFRCCGVHGEADWDGDIPISCCIKDPCNTLLHANWQEVTWTLLFLHEQFSYISKISIYSGLKKDNPANFVFQGCLVKLQNWFARNFLSTGAGVVTMFIIQVQHTQNALIIQPFNQTFRLVAHTNFHFLMSKQGCSLNFQTWDMLENLNWQILHGIDASYCSEITLNKLWDVVELHWVTMAVIKQMKSMKQLKTTLSFLNSRHDYLSRVKDMGYSRMRNIHFMALMFWLVQRVELWE